MSQFYGVSDGNAVFSEQSIGFAFVERECHALFTSRSVSHSSRIEQSLQLAVFAGSAVYHDECTDEFAGVVFQSIQRRQNLLAGLLIFNEPAFWIDVHQNGAEEVAINLRHNHGRGFP